MIDRRLYNNQAHTLADAGSGGAIKKKEEEPKENKPSYTPNYYGTVGSFKPSAAYTQAMAYTNGLLEKINSGKTSYTDKINAIMGQIENREKFSYDFNTDPLFQNALQGAMAAGQTAMQDTIGQASALTGGYGSSYATSAANQAYNEYIKGAYESLPDYYNLAKNAYDQEGQELYDRLGMYRTADESEYSRLNNAYGINLNKAESLYNKEYSNYWDTNNYNLKVAEANNDLAYKAASFAENQRQYNLDLAEQQRQFDAKTTGTSGATSLTSDVRKDFINAIGQYGTNNKSKLWDLYDMLATQGYNTDELDNLVAAYDPVLEYSPRGDGYYYDQYGYQKNLGLAGNPNATLGVTYKLVSGDEEKDDSVYMDDFGRTITYKEIKELGLEAYTENQRAKTAKDAEKKSKKK